MRKGMKFMRPSVNHISRHRNPLAVQKRKNRQRRHVLYTIHFEKAESVITVNTETSAS